MPKYKTSFTYPALDVVSFDPSSSYRESIRNFGEAFKDLEDEFVTSSHPNQTKPSILTKYHDIISKKFIISREVTSNVLESPRKSSIVQDDYLTEAIDVDNLVHKYVALDSECAKASFISLYKQKERHLLSHFSSHLNHCFSKNKEIITCSEKLFSALSLASSLLLSKFRSFMDSYQTSIVSSDERIRSLLNKQEKLYLLRRRISYFRYFIYLLKIKEKLESLIQSEDLAKATKCLTFLESKLAEFSNNRINVIVSLKERIKKKKELLRSLFASSFTEDFQKKYNSLKQLVLHEDIWKEGFEEAVSQINQVLSSEKSEEITGALKKIIGSSLKNASELEGENKAFRILLIEIVRTFYREGLVVLFEGLVDEEELFKRRASNILEQDLKLSDVYNYTKQKRSGEFVNTINASVKCILKTCERKDCFPKDLLFDRIDEPFSFWVKMNKKIILVNWDKFVFNLFNFSATISFSLNVLSKIMNGNFNLLFYVKCAIIEELLSVFLFLSGLEKEKSQVWALNYFKLISSIISLSFFKNSSSHLDDNLVRFKKMVGIFSEVWKGHALSCHTQNIADLNIKLVEDETWRIKTVMDISHFIESPFFTSIGTGNSPEEKIAQLDKEASSETGDLSFNIWRSQDYPCTETGEQYVKSIDYYHKMLCTDRKMKAQLGEHFVSYCEHILKFGEDLARAFQKVLLSNIKRIGCKDNQSLRTFLSMYSTLNLIQSTFIGRIMDDKEDLVSSGMVFKDKSSKEIIVEILGIKKDLEAAIIYYIEECAKCRQEKIGLGEGIEDIERVSLEKYSSKKLDLFFKLLKKFVDEEKMEKIIEHFK